MVFTFLNSSIHTVRTFECVPVHRVQACVEEVNEAQTKCVCVYRMCRFGQLFIFFCSIVCFPNSVSSIFFFFFSGSPLPFSLFPPENKIYLAFAVGKQIWAQQRQAQVFHVCLVDSGQRLTHTHTNTHTHGCATKIGRFCFDLHLESHLYDFFSLFHREDFSADFRQICNFVSQKRLCFFSSFGTTCVQTLELGKLFNCIFKWVHMLSRPTDWNRVRQHLPTTFTTSATSGFSASLPALVLIASFFLKLIFWIIFLKQFDQVKSFEKFNFFVIFFTVVVSLHVSQL